jgi:hypothetical protein
MPNHERAIIDPRKLRDYLLSPVHPKGASKASFFAWLGYSSWNWRRLASDLRRHHAWRPVWRTRITPYGRNFEIRASLQGPNGRSASVVSIWTLSIGETIPRFVSAYPGERE